MSKAKYGEWEIIVHISEIINKDLEGFLDLISELSVGSPCLMDITYHVIGIGKEPNTIRLQVKGDTSELL